MRCARAGGSAPVLGSVAVVASLLLAGCGGSTEAPTAGSDGSTAAPATQSPTTEDGGSSGTPAATAGVPQETGLVGVTETDADPQRGGTLTVGILSEVRGLDSAQTYSGASFGGMESAAIYDTLVRYSPATGEYEPWLAKSLEHSDDFGTWTLTLREGVKFTDGTPLNAAAVVAQVNRCRDTRYAPFVETIAGMETPNERTVVFHLVEPWSRFPFVLTTGLGKIASPTAVEKWGEEFSSHPVGAGPFVFDHFRSGEELVLTANENYWGEGPYLDKLRFVPLSGAQTKLDALNAGGIQMAFLRSPEVVAQARAAGYGGFANVMGAGRTVLINNVEGRPGADPRVRKAIAYAINVEKFNQRVYDGTGLVQKELIAETSPWATGTEATPYDPEKAKALVAEAQADGFDGKLSLLANSSQSGQQRALAIQAMLNAVGFDMTIDQAPSVTAKITKVYDGNYDLSLYAVSVMDAVPWEAFINSVYTNGATNRTGYSNPEMDALVDELFAATTEEGKQQALNGIQAVWTETVPSVSVAAISEFVGWAGDVHGVTPSAHTVMLFSHTWLSD